MALPNNPTPNEVVKEIKGISQTVSGKQDALPITSTAGKVLKSTSTAGTVEWGDVSKVYKSIAEIDSSLTTSSSVSNVVYAMVDNSYLCTEIENYTNIIPNSNYLRGVLEISKVKSGFASCKYIAAINSLSSTGAMKIWVGEFNNVFGMWTGWKELAQSTSIPDVSGKENSSNKVTSLSSSSTDTEYPSAKCVYDELANKQTSLPTVSTAGKVLKSTSIAGAVEWGEAGASVTFRTWS